MKVDVIIPVYNQFDFVRQCIHSVLESKCSTEFEILVVDDGSTDQSLKQFLHKLAQEKAITLCTNGQNLGFTRTVNSAMVLHKDRDVLLLNSDTLVYGAWLDRLVAGAYSGGRIGTVNPLTNQRGSHISCYPRLVAVDDVVLEVEDRRLNEFAAEVNAGRRVEVHTTVGFCMFIRRECLNDIGYFDNVHFPIAYGEESDFCYRARKVGWRHLVVGDAFVTHFEGKTFGEAKIRLMAEMAEKFARLHPEVTVLDTEFFRQDPVRALRARLDLARVKRMLGGRQSLSVYMDESTTSTARHADNVCLRYSKSSREIRISPSDGVVTFPNLDAYAIPSELSKLNHAMRYLGVETLRCESQSCMSEIERAVRGLEIEVALGPRLVMAS